MDSTHPQYLAQNITYTPWGAESTLENGCAGTGCTNTVETYTYNNRLQPVMIELGTTSNASADYCLVYNWYGNSSNPTSCAVPAQSQRDNGVVLGYYYQDNVNTSLSHTATHNHDYLNRLTSAFATGNATYNLTFSYDRYGNMTCVINGNTNGPCPLYSFNQSTNQISTSGFTYDAAGDLTGDGTHTYQYDAEGRQSSQNGYYETYNALGQFVATPPPWGGAWYFLYDPWGNRVGNAEQTGEMWAQMVTLGSRTLEAYSVDNAEMYFVHPNVIGSSTEDTNQTGAVPGGALYNPWGYTWSSSGSPWWANFATFDGRFMFRLYAPILGRWLSPDPLGGDISNPQSLNRYAYALNNPTTLVDPLGLCSDFDPVCNLEIDAGSSGACLGVGPCGGGLVINWPTPCNAGSPASVCAAVANEDAQILALLESGKLGKIAGGGGSGGGGGSSTTSGGSATTAGSPAGAVIPGTSLYTASANVGISVNLPGLLNFSYTLSLIFDTNGCISVGKTKGGGAGSGPLLSGEASVSVSDAQTNQDLAGPFTNAIYSAGEEAPTTLGVFQGSSPHGTVTGVTLGTGISTPPPVPVTGSVTRTNTTVTPLSQLPIPGAHCGG